MWQKQAIVPYDYTNWYEEQSFATGRTGVPPVPSGETLDLPKYNFLGDKKELVASKCEPPAIS